MLSPSVHRFVCEQQAKEPVASSGTYDGDIAILKEKTKEYAWQLRKVKVAATKKNTEVQANSIDNKYLPQWSEDRSKQTQRLQAQVERLKATEEALRGCRPSNSDKPVPIKLNKFIKPAPKQSYEKPAGFVFSSEKKLQQTNDAKRTLFKEVASAGEVQLHNYKSQLKERRENARQFQPLHQPTRQFIDSQKPLTVTNCNAYPPSYTSTSASTHNEQQYQTFSSSRAYHSPQKAPNSLLNSAHLQQSVLLQQSLLKQDLRSSAAAPIFEVDSEGTIVKGLFAPDSSHYSNHRAPISIRPTMTEQVKRRSSQILTSGSTMLVI